MHNDIPQEGLLRVKQILQIIPISRSGWWQGVRRGRFPQPIKLGPRTTAWKVEDIRLLIDGKTAWLPLSKR
ncbi:MAG: AlpA family phage regulatory protein [Syntrophales bacterium]|jgi:predicted DNA-binding transcriptional regulator AlpA